MCVPCRNVCNCFGSTHCQKYFNTPVWQLVETSEYCKQPWKQANELGQRLHRSWITLLDRNRVQCEFFNPLTWAWKTYAPHSYALQTECVWVHGLQESARVHPSRTSLFILLFIKSQYTVLHILFVCTSYLFALFILLHILLYISLFLYLYLYICSCVVLLLFNFYTFFLHCPLSGPDLIYISLLIIPCII